ncbi:hypothetical protein BVC71_02405 [Marivivens niveibacter]|uniref:Uncharacterized protein n=1 Tax=Marivivens niveibacter TaxID=1930667 RepID=A0A251X1W4_9RHOB|nr:DUF6476 family protein [Marivivens niveibacter]OUD10378.1 hypothetical protein BVC71_02405 [Marivivens niveibacter]
MDQAPENEIDPPLVTYLKRLVTAMAVVMIAGFVVLILTLVIRLNADPLPLPEQISLPDGVSAVSFTQGTDWFAVTTDADTILIYDRGTGALTQTVTIN